MKIRSLFQKISLSILCLTMLAAAASAQRPGSSTPRQEKLLNGLKLLMWSDPSATDVKMSIRIHSGSAFDPQGKEGVMKLLAENLFPTATSREFFAEDLGGSVEVISNYDYIQINATARSSEFLTLLETLAQAVSNPVIDKETTAALKKLHSEKLAVLEKDPAYIADQAAAKRLFGTFPYGRPQMGTSESLQRIDFADLLFAKERFLSSDNATVTIVGKFNGDLGYRAARRYFGAWLKSDRQIPSTFRQPDPPDTKPLEIAIDGAPAQTSFAFRGFARSDPDYFAAQILENILKARSARNSAAPTVVHEARTLPGVVFVRLSGSSGFPFNLLTDRITEAEFAAARAETASQLARRSLTDRWLDADTYRTAVPADPSALPSVALADVQRVADRLAKNPIVSIVVKPSTPAQ